MNFSNATVLVVGDIMLDRYVEGAVKRISPEAPIPVLHAGQKFSKLGGAANVALNLRDLGCKVILFGIIGRDDAGAEVATILRDSGIDTRLVVDTTRPTTVKTRFMSDGHQILRVDEEISRDLDDDTAIRLTNMVGDEIISCDAVVLSDYAKGTLSPKVIRKIVEMSLDERHSERQRDLPLIVDPKRPFQTYAGATVITPNEKELFDGTGAFTFEEALHAAVQDSFASILATRSERGMTLAEKQLFTDPTVTHFMAHAKNVVDVCGAGDTVVATLAACLAIGKSLQEATSTANLAASIVVGKRGTATVSLAELRGASHVINDKLAETHVAKDIIESWKAQNLRVGFTNGCYDLIHPGHVTMLRKCRTECDKLVVGLNSDQSVRRLKGESRPIQSENARATVLSGLTAVDLVVIFDDETPLSLIESLSPNVLMKGADYTVDTVVGAEFVIGNGGEVKLIPLEEGHSTTGLISKF